ncbi:MAG: hypothetical protein ACRDGO_08380 [Actinomycetota bacterium]
MEAEDLARGTSERIGDTGPAAIEAEGDRPELVDEGTRSTSHERCLHHPGRTAVARCNACDEPICLACAVPVRGRVIGPECLAAELGDPGLTTPPDPEQAVAGSRGAVAGAVFAVVATIGPWTQTGAGDRLLGAWVPSLRWSMVAAVTAVVLLPAAWWLRTHGPWSGVVLVVLAGTAVTSAAGLAIAFPPTFQEASWGPWIAIIGGAIAVAGAIVNTITERGPRQGV